MLTALRPCSSPASFFSRRSVLRNAVRKYRHNRPRYTQQVDQTAALGVEVLRFRNPLQATAWLQQMVVGQGVGDAP